MNRTEVELEGGGSTWWYVCGECHGMINYMQDVCKCCKSILIWDGYDLLAKYTGEHTEPAE